MRLGANRGDTEFGVFMATVTARSFMAAVTDADFDVHADSEPNAYADADADTFADSFGEADAYADDTYSDAHAD